MIVGMNKLNQQKLKPPLLEKDILSINNKDIPDKNQERLHHIL